MENNCSEPGEYIGNQVILNIVIGSRVISITLEEKLNMSDGVIIIDVGTKEMYGFGGIGCIVLSIAKARELGFNCNKIIGMHDMKMNGRMVYKIKIENT